MAIEDLYNSNFDLYRNVLDPIPNAIGGISRTPTIIASTIPCYVTYLSGEEQVLYGKNNIPATHRLFTANTYEIRSTDLVYFAGDEWDVLYIDNCNKMYHHLEVLIKLVKSPQIVFPESSSSESSESSESSSSSDISSSSSSSSVGGCADSYCVEGFAADYNGTYYFHDYYDDKPYYKNASGTRYLYWSTSFDLWWLDDSFPVSTRIYFSDNGVSCPGDSTEWKTIGHVTVVGASVTPGVCSTSSSSSSSSSG